MYDTASKLYNGLLRTYSEEYYYDLSVAERKIIDHISKPKELFLEDYNYKPWLKMKNLLLKKNG